MKLFEIIAVFIFLLLAGCSLQIGQPLPPTATPSPSQIPPPTETPTIAQTPTPLPTLQIPEADLVAYYPFEGSAADASGHHNDGTLHGPTLTIDRFGHPDGAYSFDGVNDYILVPDSDSLEFTSDFSLALWVKPEASDNDKTAFLLEKIPGAEGIRIVDAWWFGIRRDTSHQVIFSTAPDFDHDSTTSRGVTFGAWTCVVFTYHAVDRAWTFYLNGQIDNQGTNDRRQIGTSAPMAIGGFPWEPEPLSLFIGSLDDISIYQRTLSPEEALGYCANNARNQIP